MSVNLVQKLLLVSILTVFLIKIVTGESSPTSSDFRILAPQFICPRETSGDDLIVKSDNTIITIQTKAGADLYYHWIVRWKPLFGATQRFTLMVWDTVRVLEVKLNAPQRERYVYVIDNKQLLRGIEYTFNVTGIAASGELGATKYFTIDNTRGEQELQMTEGRADLFSVVLLGSLTAYADVEFVIEARVTTCHATQDYYFVWQVQSVNFDLIDTSKISGSRLEIPPYVLKAGLSYNIICQIIKLSNGFFITQSNLLFTVISGGLEIYTGVDQLIVTANRTFTLESMTVSHDYHPDNLTYLWECRFKDKLCIFFQNSNDKSLTVSSGLPEVGRYLLTVKVTAMDQSATAAVIIEVVKSVLPVIQIDLIQRVHNEGKVVSLTANVSDIVPTCKLTWYYASQAFLTNEVDVNDTCIECQHGEALTESVTLYSLEENFLYELIDFTNETEWRQVSVEMTVTAAGRARLVAKCGCSPAFDCDTEGTAYADIALFINKSPKSRDVMLSPESGTALETVFRISTSSAMDSDIPLRYSFYCRVGTNDTLLLASYIEYLAADTVLPYVVRVYEWIRACVDGVTEVWVEVCDSRDTCSVSTARAVAVAAGSGHTAGVMLEAARAHLRRCEVIQLRKVIISSLVTYYNTEQTEILSSSAGQLLLTLSEFVTYNCTSSNNDDILGLMDWIAVFGP